MCNFANRKQPKNMHQNYIKYKAERPPKYPQSFTGKERDSETGFSYFGARYYDSDILTSWLSVDPMADKYPSLSPYNYCALNPIRIIDPNGDSCAVLLAGKTLWPVRHIAVLVQGEGDDNNWYLYSKDGEGKIVSGIRSGTQNQKGLEAYTSVQDFIDNYRLKEDDKEPYYTEAYILPTTPEQDKTIRETMINELDKKYSLVGSNCAQAVNNSLIAAGVKTNKISSNDLIRSIQCITSPSFVIDKFVDDYILDKIIPITMYSNIKHANPNGIIVK